MGVNVKKLLLISLLIFSCEELLQSIKEGCTTATACNYDATATKDDGVVSIRGGTIVFSTSSTSSTY